jgi:hypothetical protein
MKNSPIFVILLLFWPFLLPAQPVLTQGQHMLQYGDTVVRQTYSFNSISPGPAGANVTWDFTQLQPLFVESGEVQPVLNMPLFAYNYQIAFSSPTFTHYMWYQAGADTVTFAGHNRSSLEPDIAEFWDSDVLLRLPMHYGDQHTDSYWGRSTAMLRPPHFSGTSSIDADAYGTLLLPGRTYTDVLRVHKHDVVFDSVNTSTFDTWYYYSASQCFPVLVYGDNTYFNGTYAISNETRSGLVSAQEAAMQRPLELRRNPVQDELVLRVAAQGELRVTGVDGKVHHQSTVPAGRSDLRIPFGHVAPGVYLVSLTTVTGNHHQKFIHLGSR